MVYVIKADGSKEEFDYRKIIRTCLRAGASRPVADGIAQKLNSLVKNGWSTHSLYQIILEELDKREDKTGLVMRLRDAIANIDPQHFEKFSKKVLEAHGYECEWNIIVQGKCVEHQVDIIAKKDRLFLVECKRHFNPHRMTGLGVAMQVQARLEDIDDGFSLGKNATNFDFGWILTNTKFSDHAKVYSGCKNIRLTGWNSGPFALEKMVNEKRAFPVTILKTDLYIQKQLLDKGIITVIDLLENENVLRRIKIPKDEMKSIISQARMLFSQP